MTARPQRRFGTGRRLTSGVVSALLAGTLLLSIAACDDVVDEIDDEIDDEFDDREEELENELEEDILD